MNIRVRLNGLERTFTIKPDEFLIDTLRNHHLVSVRRGCDTSSCGVCTILVDDKPVPSCTYLSARADKRHITTVEGIPNTAARLAGLFGNEGADQCGFCNPGLALSVHALEKLGATPDAATIRHYLVGHLCRCSGYVSQIKAVKAYLEEKS